MKKLVVTGLANRIVLANVNDKTHTITGEKVDMTDEAVCAVSEHMMTLANDNKDDKGFWQFIFKGQGTLTWDSEKSEKKEKPIPPEVVNIISIKETFCGKPYKEKE